MNFEFISTSFQAKSSSGRSQESMDYTPTLLRKVSNIMENWQLIDNF